MARTEPPEQRTAMTKIFPSLLQKVSRACETLRAHLEGRPNEIVDGHLERSSSLVTLNRKPRELRVLAVASVVGEAHRGRA